MIDWLKKIIGGKQEVQTALCKDVLVYVYSVTETYALISYKKDGTGIFAVGIDELKNLK